MTTAQAKPINTKLYFSIYCLAFAFDGFLLGFLGAIYVELQQSLNTSVVVISWIYSSLSIGYVVSNLACGLIADRIQEVHRVQSLLLLTCGICAICVPFNTNIAMMFVLFVLIGIGWAANETYFTLFVFRLYPHNGSKMYFLTALIVTSFSILTALSIEFSLSIANSYAFPFVLFGCIAIVHAIAVALLKTPVHDKHRAIKRSLKTNTSNTPKSTLDEEKLAEIVSSKLEQSNCKTLQNATVALLLLCMGFHAVAERGLLAYTTVYCRDYLGIDDKYGRYFISCYFGGSITIRILRQIFAANSSPVYAVFVAYILRFITQFVFVAIPSSESNVGLFVIYALLGMCAGFALPGLCSWAELIRPTTGFVASLWWIIYGVGDAIITFSMGAIVSTYGAKWIPFVVSVPLLAAIIANGIAVALYRMIKRQEANVLEQVKTESIGEVELK